MDKGKLILRQNYAGNLSKYKTFRGTMINNENKKWEDEILKQNFEREKSMPIKWNQSTQTARQESTNSQIQGFQSPIIIIN